MVRYRRYTSCKKIKRIVSGFEIPCIHKSFELCEECNKKVMENLRKMVKKNESIVYKCYGALDDSLFCNEYNI
jgi:hypothetical protein